MPTKAEIEALDRARIAKAQHFVVSLYMGFNGSWVKKAARTLAEAKAEAAAMDADLGAEAGGRRSMIFAVEKCGRETFVPKNLQPQTGDTTMPNPAEKFASKFSAQRSAKRAGYGADTADVTKTEEGGWTWTPKAAPASEQEAKSAEAEAALNCLPPMAESTEDRVNQKIEALAEHLVEKVAKKERKPREPKADAKPAPVGKRKAIEDAARAGILPTPPDFSAETHKRFRPVLARLIDMAAAGDLDGLRAEKINPISSSPKALDKYRNLCVMALEAKMAPEVEAAAA